MKVMITAFVAALIIAALAPAVLNQFGWSSAELYSNPESVRLE